MTGITVHLLKDSNRDYSKKKLVKKIETLEFSF